MKARWVRCGEIEVEGERYGDDLVIDGGRVAKRRKKASKRYRDRYGHTPLSAEEPIPWGGKRLVVGTGESGRLPVMPEVYEEAERRGVEVVALPTEEALRLLGTVKTKDVYAVLHVTC
jgi:hypothetical protein